MWFVKFIWTTLKSFSYFCGQKSNNLQDLFEDIPADELLPKNKDQLIADANVSNLLGLTNMSELKPSFLA